MLRLSLLFLFISSSIFAQDAKTLAVMIETEISDEGFAPQIIVSWQNDSLATKYIVSKREYETGKFEKIAELSGGANTFSDLDFDYNKVTEYEVEKVYSFNEQLLSTKSYKAVSWDADLTENGSKTILILIEINKYKGISAKLNEYRSVLRKEGWIVITKQVPRVEDFNPKAVLSNRELIKAIWKESQNLTTVLLLGRVAVPYSGNIAPDGHGDNNGLPHKGAYPTDAFYADMDTRDWTDTSESNKNSAFPRQHNVVNDGKWDQSFIPGKVELAIGRVDFYNLDFFEESETELINRYLTKNIEYRTGILKADNDAILYDGFDGRQRGYAADGWNNLTALYGRDNVTEMRVREELPVNSYEMVYANAEGGFDNIYDAIYAIDVARDGYNGIHNMIFGSYNVDWGSPNNLLRSLIASEPMGLTVVWVTRPFWTYYKLGLGETFGEALVSTQNNRFEYDYPSVSYKGGVHVALIGDPTLKLINELPLDSASFIYDNDDENITGIRIKLKDNESIVGYQLMFNNEVHSTEFFEEEKEGEFTYDLPNAISKNEIWWPILRPIVKISNQSGRFNFLGSGVYIQ